MRDFDTPYTPAITLVRALGESLRAIRAVGIENIWAKTQLLGRAVRAGIEALGLQLVAVRPADAMTAVYFPENFDGKRFLRRQGMKTAGHCIPLA